MARRVSLDLINTRLEMHQLRILVPGLVVTIALVFFPEASGYGFRGADQSKQAVTRKTGASEGEMKQRRRKAANRQRRIIFSNDGNEVFFPYSDDPRLNPDPKARPTGILQQSRTPTAQPLSLVKEVTANEVLRHRTLPLLGSQVDSIFYCTLSSGFGLFTHNTKVGEVFNKKVGIVPYNITQELIDKGTDPLQIMVEFCRKNGIEIFWSMRMNDTHDASHKPDDPHFLFPKLKEAHPEYLFGTRENPPKYGTWSAVNYSRAEIRELAFRYIEEVCQNYDMDGVELDFFRHPQLFKGVGNGAVATPEELEMMTEFMRRVRKMADTTGAKRSKPVLIALKVPDSVEFCRAIGIDLERWLAEDLADILVPGGYFQLNHSDYSVNLGHKYGVRVYPALEESRVPLDADGKKPQNDFEWFDSLIDKVRRSDHAYYARALDSWNAGADGIYLYNFFWEYENYHLSLSNFSSHRLLLEELGDPLVLKNRDKVYFASVQGVSNALRWVTQADQYFRKPALTVLQPMTIVSGTQRSIEIIVGDDVHLAAKEGMNPQVSCHLRIKPPEASQLVVKLNNTVLSGGTQAEKWLDYGVGPSVVKRGTNKFEIAFRSKPEDKILLSDLLLKIHYGSSKAK